MSQYKTVYLPVISDSKKLSEGIREIISLVEGNGQAISSLRGGDDTESRRLSPAQKSVGKGRAVS
ncbi:MAG: hypothetical protein AB7E31_14635 [Desulfitobacterium sp.]